jgi:hypothetical protein
VIGSELVAAFQSTRSCESQTRATGFVPVAFFRMRMPAAARERAQGATVITVTQGTDHSSEPW